MKKIASLFCLILITKASFSGPYHSRRRRDRYSLDRHYGTMTINKIEENSADSEIKYKIQKKFLNDTKPYIIQVDQRDPDHEYASHIFLMRMVNLSSFFYRGTLHSNESLNQLRKKIKQKNNVLCLNRKGMLPDLYTIISSFSS